MLCVQAAVDLCGAYHQQYQNAKMTLAANPSGPQFHFDETAIFLKFDLYIKRLHKLIAMFTTIHQFSTLEQHMHIEGLDQMIKNLNNIIDDVKRKPYDLLDFSRNQFDRDFLEFNVNINDLELHLQVGISMLYMRCRAHAVLINTWALYQLKTTSHLLCEGSV